MSAASGGATRTSTRRSGISTEIRAMNVDSRNTTRGQDDTTNASPTFQDLAAAALVASATEATDVTRTQPNKPGSVDVVALGNLTDQELSDISSPREEHEIQQEIPTGLPLPQPPGSGVVSNRTARACSWCRRRKRKCDGQRPTCCWCAKGNLACNYPSALLKRGPQSGMMRKLKQKVEELEQELNIVRVLPPALNVDGATLPPSMSLTAFIQRVRAARQYHDAILTIASGNQPNPQQATAIQLQSPATTPAIRDRLYLTSFLVSFNTIFPLLDREWESTYLQLLYDELGTMEPPLYWSFQYASAIAIGAIIHDDPQYALESALAARHAASTLFDEAHSQVLRGLLLLSFLLIGLGQTPRASCYIAVANRMLYLLSRPVCIDPNIPNANHSITSPLAFPGTFPQSRVPLILPPQPSESSSMVTNELKLMYTLVEDMSSSANTLHGMIQIGWDRVERFIVEAKKAKSTTSAPKVNPLPISTPSASSMDATMSNLDLSVTMAPLETVSPGAASSSPTSAVVTPKTPLSNDHLLTLGLDCRHYSKGIFDHLAPQVESWASKMVMTPTLNQPSDLSVAHSSILHILVFLTSFRGDFMQLVRPLVGEPPIATMPPSTAMSSELFQISLTNTRVALKIAEMLCDTFTIIPISAAAQTPKSTARLINSLMSESMKSPETIVKVEGETIADGAPAQPPGASMPSLLMHDRLARLLTQVSTPLVPLHKQTARQQLHVLAHMFKAIFMHMLVLEQETDPAKNIVTPVDEPPAPVDRVSTTSSTTSLSSLANPLRLTWSNVILTSNTATSFADFHQIDLSYCPFFTMIIHLNIQIKLKYVKQCMASWKRAQLAHSHILAKEKEKTEGVEVPELSPPSPPSNGAAVSLPTATQSLLDSLHYLHIDFIVLDSLHQHWSGFAAGSIRDAQDRIAELLNYLRVPVGHMTVSAATKPPALETAVPIDSSTGALSSAAATASTPTSDVNAKLLEEALRVHQTISERYPLFTPGASHPKQLNPMISASLLPPPATLTPLSSATSTPPTSGHPVHPLQPAAAGSPSQTKQQPENAPYSPPVTTPNFPSVNPMQPPMPIFPPSGYPMPPMIPQYPPTLPPQQGYMYGHMQHHQQHAMHMHQQQQAYAQAHHHQFMQSQYGQPPYGVMPLYGSMAPPFGSPPAMMVPSLGAPQTQPSTSQQKGVTERTSTVGVKRKKGESSEEETETSQTPQQQQQQQTHPAAAAAMHMVYPSPYGMSPHYPPPPMSPFGPPTGYYPMHPPPPNMYGPPGYGNFSRPMGGSAFMPTQTQTQTQQPPPSVVPQTEINQPSATKKQKI